MDTLAAAKAAKDVTINYGLFINAVINFLIVAFVLFLLIRQINKLVAPSPATEAAPAAVGRSAAAARNPRLSESPVMQASWSSLLLLLGGVAGLARADDPRRRGGERLSMPSMAACTRGGGIPDATARARLAAFLSPAPEQAAGRCARRPRRASRQDQGFLPPLIEGDLFSSLFEGATPVQARAPAAATAKARRAARASLAPMPVPRQKPVNWTDTLLLVNTPQGWKVDDIAYDGRFCLRQYRPAQRHAEDRVTGRKRHK